MLSKQPRFQDLGVTINHTPHIDMTLYSLQSTCQCTRKLDSHSQHGWQVPMNERKVQERTCPMPI